MKTIYNMIAPLTLTLVFQSSASAQEAVPSAPVRTTLISYSKEVPPANTYTVTRNTNKSTVPVEVLELINLHRRHDEVVIWKVSEALEILIYPFGTRKEGVDE